MDAIKAHAQVAALDRLAERLSGDERALEEIEAVRAILMGHPVED